MEIFKKILGWLITILIPVLLILLGVRVLISPIFIQVEYRMPGFPEDPYGFTRAERLYWADLSRKYLTNREGIEYLGELQFPSGVQAAAPCEDYLPPRDCGYFYNDRELQHMLDVKILVRYAMGFFWVSLLGLLGIGFWAKRANWWEDFKWALSRGGWLTVGLVVALMIYLALNFNQLFIGFHQLFFSEGTWMFRFSDSLIRLFPVRFWRDAFIWVGVIALGGGVILGYWGGRKSQA